jgi:hypothetical protein
MLAATIVFALSFALIIGLFGLKYFEMRRGERVAKAMRVKADRAALELKDTLVHGRQQIEKLPPEIAHVSMRAMVAGALSAASLGSTRPIVLRISWLRSEDSNAARRRANF